MCDNSTLFLSQCGQDFKNLTSYTRELRFWETKNSFLRKIAPRNKLVGWLFGQLVSSVQIL